METTNMNYRDAMVQMPEPPKRTIVDMSGELKATVEKLVAEVNNLTMRIVGTRCDLPNGGEGPLPERLTWDIEALQRLHGPLGDAWDFLGLKRDPGGA